MCDSLLEYKNNGKYWPNGAKYLVIVHEYDGDVAWTSKLKFPYIIYEKDKPDLLPFSAPNKAKGESNMIKFICEFYNELPENLIQVYQYEYKHYHGGSRVDILNDPLFEIKYKNSFKEGFWNFNNVVLGYVHTQIAKMLSSGGGIIQ